MYNRYLRNDDGVYTRMPMQDAPRGEPPRDNRPPPPPPSGGNAPPPRPPQGDAPPPPPISQEASQFFSRILDKLPLKGVDTADILLLLILFFLFEEKADDELLVALGLLLVAMGTYRSPAVALMPDVTPKPLRSKANAVINLMGSAGGIIVLALGMVFATASVSNSMMSYTGYFGVIAALMLAALVVFMLTVREPEWAREMQAQSVAAGVENAEEAAHPNEGRKLSADEVKSLLLILLSIVLWFFGYNAVTSKYSVYASNILHKDYNLTLIIAQAAAIAAYLPVGFIAGKIGRKKTILAGVVMLTVAFGVAGFLTADSPSALMNAMFALAGIAWATINVNSFPMVVELASGGDVGKYTGFYYTASMAAQVATPMVSGLLMDKFGMHVLFPYAAVFTALAFVTMLFVKHGDSREVPKQTAAAGTEDAGAIDNTVEELTND